MDTDLQGQSGLNNEGTKERSNKAEMGPRDDETTDINSKTEKLPGEVIGATSRAKDGHGF
jgi:hypothetical protein